MKNHRVLIGISSGLVVLLLALVYVLQSIFFSDSALGNQAYVTHTQAGMTNTYESQVGQREQGQTEDTIVYSTFSLYEQDPVSVNGTVQLKTDQQYFFDAEMGNISTVQVRDGQHVKKNDILFAYEVDSQQAQYDIEDTLRDQTRLYNQRENLLAQLTQLSGAYYNYQGDKISSYWDYSGKQGYYVEEAIGDSTHTEDSSDFDDNLASGEEALKEQIRQVNQQIDDIEVKLIRLKEQQHGRILAKSEGVVILNEEGKDSNHVAFIRIISDEVSVVGSVSEYEFYTLAQGRAVNLYINAEDRNVAGEIITFDQFPTTHVPTESGQGGNSVMGSAFTDSQFNFTIKPEEFIQPGFSVKIGIQLPGVVIPTEAILEESGQSYVFVYQEGTVEKRAVTIERQGSNRVVHRELTSGEILVLHPYDLQGGQAITTDFDMMGQTNEYEGSPANMEDSW